MRKGKTKKKSLSNEEIKDHNAAASWDGFNYQGHVALYVVLEMIYDLKIPYTDLAKYYFELEGIEDFAIFKNDECISIHQVKSSSDIISYSDITHELKKIKKKLKKTNSASAFFHHSVKIKDIEVELKDNMEFLDTNFTNIFLYYYKKLKQSFVSIKDIEHSINEYIKEVFSDAIEKIENKNDFVNISFSILSMLIIMRIRRIRLEIKNSLSPTKSQRGRDATQKEKITFLEVFNTVNEIVESFNSSESEYLKQLTVLYEYMYYYFLDALVEEESGIAGTKKLDNHSVCLAHMNGLFPLDKKKYYRLITPHRYIPEFTKKYSDKFFSRDELRTLYFYIIYQIDKDIQKKVCLFYTDNEGKKYLPAAMSFTIDTKTQVDTFFSQSIQDDTIFKVIYEYDYMIANTMKEYTIDYSIFKNLNTKEEIMDNEHITRTGFKIIGINDAKGKLNVTNT